MKKNTHREEELDLGLNVDQRYISADIQLARTLVNPPGPRLLRTKRVTPIEPDLAKKPRHEYGPRTRKNGIRPPNSHEDPKIFEIARELLFLDPYGIRFAYAIREALDQIYDGRRTGRWDFTQLSKTEKTHIGTLIEIWLQKEFEFDAGEQLDFNIRGTDVDCKWSRELYSWEIPIEMYSRGNKIALLIWANEYTAKFAVGLIRVTEDVLRPKNKQRDGKRTLSFIGRDRILWVYAGQDMIKNILIHRPDAAKKIAMESSGQKAINMLFREVQGELITRATVETVGQQVDSINRVRKARVPLARDGILIFGHYGQEPELAESFGLPRPTLGRFVSGRVAPWAVGDRETPVQLEDGRKWRRARPEDSPVSVMPLSAQAGAGVAKTS